MVDDEKLEKKEWLKRPKAVPKKWNLHQNMRFKMSYLEFLFWKCYFVHTFLHFSWHSSGNHQSFFLNFRFSNRKSQSHQKLTKKIIHFTITQFRLENLTHYMNLNYLTWKIIFLQRSQKPYWLYKFSSKLVSVWFQKKYLHCIISWRPRTVFLKHLESKCLYISIYLLKKTFVSEM